MSDNRMNACPDALRLSAYHDGELPPADRTDVELHLDDCPPCTEYLGELGRVSAWLVASAGASAVRLSPIARARLHRRVDAVMEQGLVRFGWELSGIAAAVLLAGSAWLMWATSATPASAATASAMVPPWVGAQVAAVADPVAQQQPATPAAAWYLADGSARD